MRRIIAIVVLAAACGGKKSQPTTPPSNQPVAEVAPAPAPAPEPTPPPPLTDAMFETMMGQAVAMFVAMGNVADASGSDCHKFAVGLEQVVADNQDFIDRAKQYKDDPDIDKRGEEWMNAHRDQVMDPMMKVAGAGQKCAGDAEFMAVLNKLGELGN